MAEMRRATLFVMHGDDDSDYNAVLAWLEHWGNKVRIADYSTGGWEHLWDIEATPEALAEVPPHWFCDSGWTGGESP